MVYTSTFLLSFFKNLQPFSPILHRIILVAMSRATGPTRQPPPPNGGVRSCPTVVIQLMKKSDWEGIKRFASNVSFMALTALAIHHFGMLERLRDMSSLDALPSVVLSRDMVLFVVLYFIYGFQMQCMAFAGGHEMLHGMCL